MNLQLNYTTADKATHLSYGTRTGNFIIDDKTLQLLCLDDIYFKNYAFVEKRTPYYVLIFDFDFKLTHPFIYTYIDKSEEIVDHIIYFINIILAKVFVKPDVRYVYCDKNEGKGCHLYYPEIIVSDVVHEYIYNKVIELVLKNDKYGLTEAVWTKIFDSCVTSHNGLRYPYCMKDNNYYKPNELLSTYPIPKSKYEIIKICSIRTDRLMTQPDLKDNKINIPIEKKKQNKISNSKNKNIISANSKNSKNMIFERISVRELDNLLSCFHQSWFDNYSKWKDILFYSYNCNNTEEACQVFYKYCQVDEYKDVPYDEIKKHYYGCGTVSYFNPNILRYQARQENKKLFDTFKLDIPYDKKTFPTIQFTSKYLIDLNPVKSKMFMDDYINNFIKSNNKFLITKASYGGGKSVMIEHIASTNVFKRILFITHRRSLATDFMLRFQKLGFQNYLNKGQFDINSDRLIINIDSLHLLKHSYNFFSGRATVKEFDLVVLDECCSLLKHFESSLLEDRKDYIYTIFHEIVKETKKIIACDGDISNREYFYFKKFEDNLTVLENMYLPRKYNYKIHFDEYKYIELIKKDLESGLNLSIVSASASFCHKLKMHFEKTYKVICITADTDDVIKKQMTDSQKLLTQYQVFIYSPAITVGVDISYKYFDRIYGYLCGRSITARDFLQMINRVRNPTFSDIHILIDSSISKSQIGNYYEFDEVKFLFSDKLSLNPNDLTLYQILRLWNKFEDINNENYIFPIFLHMLAGKGHDYEIMDELKQKIFNKLLVDDIINAINITENEFIKYLEKQRIGEGVESERASIEKYMYCKEFNVSCDEITNDFMKSHYNKLHIVKNHKMFMNYLNDIKCESDNNKYDDQNMNLKLEAVKKLINHFGYMQINDTVQKEDFENKIVKLNDIVDAHFRYLFNMKKEEVDKLSKVYKTNQKILGFVNSLIENYGIEIVAVNKKITDKETKKRNMICEKYILKKLYIISDIPIQLISYELVDK